MTSGRRGSGRRDGARVTAGGRRYPEQQIPNMVAFWDPARGVTLSGSSVLTVADMSGAGDVLTTTAGERPTWTANDTGYPAFNFSGTLQRFEVPDSADLSPVGALSVSVWVKRGAAGATHIIIAKWVAPTFPWLLYFDNANNLVVELNGSAQVGFYAFGAGTGTWKHIVMVFDGSLSGNANRLKLYENGVQKVLGFAGTVPATLADDAQPLALGALVGGATALNGSMGHVAVIQRAITAAEIATLAAYQPR